MSLSYTFPHIRGDTFNYVFMNHLYCTWINSMKLTCPASAGGIGDLALPHSYANTALVWAYLQGKYTQPTRLYICRMYVSIKHDKISIYKLSRSSEGRWLTYTITQNICTHFKSEIFWKVRPLSGSVYLSIRPLSQITSAFVVNLALIPLCNTPNP